MHLLIYGGVHDQAARGYGFYSNAVHGHPKRDPFWASGPRFGRMYDSLDPRGGTGGALRVFDDAAPEVAHVKGHPVRHGLPGTGPLFAQLWGKRKLIFCL